MKATMLLPNGTKVEIDGDADEVRRLLNDFSGALATLPLTIPPKPKPKSKTKTKAKPAAARAQREDDGAVGGITELAVVNHIKEDEAFQWVHAILDSKDQMLRALVVLYVAAETDPQGPGVTTGFISRVYLELGVRLTTANVSSELAGRAKKYVLADAVRRKGAAVNYKLSRVGRAFIESKRDA
jgi:hypothetical protein